jgi:nicotinamidase-related amidase
MPASDTAVLVIDAQESFRYRPYWSEADLPAFVAGVQSLVDGAKARGIPVARSFTSRRAGPSRSPRGTRLAGRVEAPPSMTFGA